MNLRPHTIVSQRHGTFNALSTLIVEVLLVAFSSSSLVLFLMQGSDSRESMGAMKETDRYIWCF